MNTVRNLLIISIFAFTTSNSQEFKAGDPISAIDESGNRVFVYKTKKYGIPCERKFELNKNNIIETFTSSGCL